MNAKDYIAANSDKWFLTGKTEYTVQAMTVSKKYLFIKIEIKKHINNFLVQI